MLLGRWNLPLSRCLSTSFFSVIPTGACPKEFAMPVATYLSPEATPCADNLFFVRAKKPLAVEVNQVRGHIRNPNLRFP